MIATMWVLHGLWRADRRLALWAEDGTAHQGRYGVDPVAVRGLLAAVGPGLEWLVEQAEPGVCALLLPTREGVPLPSPELVGPLRGGSPAGVRLLPWRVPCLLFTPAQAAQLLGELHDPGNAVLQPDLPGAGPVEAPYGASLRWLTRVHDLAWRLVGRGRVLPGLADREPGDGPSTEPGPWARWVPAADGAARREAAALAADCPPVCRAEAPAAGPGSDASGSGGGRTGAALVTELLAVLVDCEVRAVLSERSGLLPQSRGRSRPAATAAEHWLAALTSPSGQVLGADRAELALVESRLTAWHRSATAERGPLRLVFRLAEPFEDGWDPGAAADLVAGAGRTMSQAKPEVDPNLEVDGETDRAEDDHWLLELTLQCRDDPSVRVDAAQLWEGGAAAAPLLRLVDRPHQAFQAELERAVQCCPELDPLLEQHRPSRLGLDRAGALAFLRDTAPALAAAGFGVLLPVWWARPPTLGLALTGGAVQAGVVERESLLAREDLVEFRWSAALGGEPISDEELKELAAAKHTLVRIRGRWFEADPARIAAAAAFLARRAEGLMAPGELLRIALDGREPGTGLPVLFTDAEGRLGELLRQVRPALDAADDTDDASDASPAGADRAAAKGLSPEPVALPADFGAVLRPYQERGLAWLVFLSRLGLGGVLADDMGLGKTVQTLALLAVEHAEAAARGRRPGPTLVVCPMSLVGNWTRECARFAPALQVHVHHGSGRADGAGLARAVAGTDVVVTTYGLVQRDFTALRAVAWRRVVADEAHHIKNGATQQSRAIRELPALQRLALTGTPVENRLAELHSVLDFANPGLFGSAEGFKERYSVPIERNASRRATADLLRRTRPFVLRRSKTDPLVAADLPGKQEMTVLCNLTAEQAALYQAVVEDLLARMERARLDPGHTVQRRGLVLAALTRLKQICNHPAHYSGEGGAPGRPPQLSGRSGKLARLEDTLEEALAEGDRTLCFTQYTEFGALLQPYLAERLDSEVLFLHGGMTKRQRDAAVDRFQDPDGPSVFLLSLRAGGVGLNLTAANQVIHMDRWWNPAVEDQATDRAFRLGQQRDVQVRRFVCVGTVEERVDAMIEEKRALADAVVGSGESWLGDLGDLSTDALREVLALTEDAVSER
ncbi:DEAD/DEAH box helicase [Streptacidiphilus sp. N1-10]|uniref:DEAD/DEAH box helicase n=1 Tax=Streptacidiphilus jeojiensis TaxID=3229225 RepID=A0ABV6XFG1_9ACTN